MPTFDDIISEATHRLRIDRELQLDVAQELRNHLEDAAEEFRAAGHNDDAATAHAIAALGDPRKLSDDLWTANRGRVRLRYWVKWTLRVTLIPACLILMLWVPLRHYQAQQQTTSLLAAAGMPIDTTSMMSAEVVRRGSMDHPLLRHATPEERFRLLGDPGASTPLEIAASIIARYPQDRVYYAWYTLEFLREQPIDPSQAIDPDVVAARLAVLEKGAQLDPTNALYPLLIADTLLPASCDYVSQFDALKQGGPQYQAIQSDGSLSTGHVDTIRVRDQAMFERGLSAYLEASRKPRITTYSVARVADRLGVLPPPHGVNDYVTRQMGLASAVFHDLVPFLGLARRCSRYMAAAGLLAAQQGEAATAYARVEAVKQVGARIGADAEALTELLVGVSIDALGTTYAMYVSEALDRPDDWQAALERYETMRDAMQAARPTAVNDDPSWFSGGILTSLMRRSGSDAITLAARQAERAQAEQFASACLVGLGALAAGGAAIGAMARRWWRRDDNEPGMLVLVGWRRTAMVLLAGVISPLALYLVGTRAVPTALGIGILPFIPTLAAAMGTGLVALALVIALSARAVRQRMTEIGVTRPGPGHGTLARSAAMLVALAAVVFGAFAVAALQRAETNALARIVQMDAFGVVGEIDRSGHAQIQQRYRQQTRDNPNGG